MAVIKLKKLYVSEWLGAENSQNIVVRYLDGSNIDQIERMRQFPIQGTELSK